MERIKQKLLTIILIVIVGIVGYQAYVMAAETYGRWAGARVPFYSNGVRIYCREHHNGWAYGSGADTGNTYQCTGEYRTLDHGANGFAYYVSRVGFAQGGGYADSVQTLIWNNSGASQGSTILNMNSNFVGWFEGYNGINFGNIGASNENLKDGDPGYTTMLTKNETTLSSYVSDYTTKVAEIFPDNFFSKTYVNNGKNYVPAESSQTQNTNDFIENEFETSKEELKKIDDKYFPLINISNDKNTNKKTYDYNTFRNIIDQKQIDWKNITTAEKEKLIEDCLKDFGVYWIPEEENEKSQIGTKIMQEVRELLSSPNIKETLKNEYKVDEKEIDEIANKIEFIKEELKVKNFLKSDEGLKETTSGEYAWNVYEENIAVPEAERSNNKDKISEMENFAKLALKCSAMNGTGYDVPSIQTDNGNIVAGASSTDATNMLQMPKETVYKDGMDDSRLWYYMYYLLDKTKIVDKYDEKTIKDMQQKFPKADQEEIREKRVFEYAEATAYAIAEQGAVTQVIEDYIATKCTSQMTTSGNIADIEVEEIDLFLKHNKAAESTELKNAKEDLKQHRDFTNLNDDDWDSVVNDIEKILKNEAFKSELKDELGNNSNVPYNDKTIHDEAENIAYEIQQQQYDGASEDSDKITEISFEEYKYLYELFKLYQHFYNMDKAGNSNEIKNYSNGTNVEKLEKHLNTYWDDGIGSLYREQNEKGEWVNKTKLVATHKWGEVKTEVKTNVYGEKVIIYTNTNINRSSTEGLEGKNDKGGATLWKYVEDDDITKDGKIEPKTETLKDAQGKEQKYYTGSGFYYEDDQNATVALFDGLLCMQENSGSANCIGTNNNHVKDEEILKKYAEYFYNNAHPTAGKTGGWGTELCKIIDDRYKDLADIIRNPFEQYEDGTYKHPEIVELLKTVKFGGTAGDKAGKDITSQDYLQANLYDRLQVIFTAYEKQVKKIAGETTAAEALWGDGSFNLVNLGERDSLDIRYSTTTWEAARVYQWLKKVPNPTTEPGVTNMDKIAGQVKVDDSNANVYIDSAKGKYLIGPYTLNYATITLNNEQILGVQGFDLKLDILKKDGTTETKTLTRGDGADQYKLVTKDNSTKKVKVGGKIVSVPKSGSPFYIELDKSVKGNGEILTENDTFSFSLDYKFLDKIEAVVHFLRDCTRSNDAANPTSPDWQWSSSHPQRLVAITFSQTWDEEKFSTETKTREYDFKLRKIDKDTRVGVNDGKFVAAAKYKNVKTGNTAYFDLETRTQNLGSNFSDVVNKAKQGQAKTYISASQPEGDGWILWNDIPDSIAEIERDEKGNAVLSSMEDKQWTLECVEVQETEAPNGYRIPTKEELEIPEGYNTQDNVNNSYTISIPKNSSRELTWAEPSVPKEYNIPFKKIDNKQQAIKNLNLEYWFADLTVDYGSWASQDWKYGPGKRHTVNTGDSGKANFVNDMYGDAILLVIEEKPTGGYGYQYFKKIAIVYSATRGTDSANIKFLNYSDISKNETAKKNLDNWINKEEKVEIDKHTWSNGVLFIEDKSGNVTDATNKVTTKEGKGIYLNSKTTQQEVNGELITITNDEIPPYDLELFKFETGGEYNTNLAGTKFRVSITIGANKEAAYEKEIEVKEIDENGKKVYVAKADGIRVYGDNLALHIQETYTKPGFESKLTVKTIALIYKAEVENGKAKLTILENTPNEKVFVSDTSKLPDGLKGGSAITINNNSSIHIGIDNTPVPHYLKFFKVDDNGKPLEGATFTLANKNPTEEGFDDSNILGTATSGKDGYMEFAVPSEAKGASKDYTLYLYEESSGEGHLYSDTNKEHPITIKYSYVAGADSITNLSIMHNGQNLASNNTTLHCQQEEQTKEDGTKVTVNSMKNNGYIFDFGKLNEIFKLINKAVPYSLEWEKVEDTTDTPLGNAKFEVSIVQGIGSDKNNENKTDVIKEIAESLNNGNSDNILRKGISFAQYKNGDNKADIKNLGRIQGEGEQAKQQGQNIVSSDEENTRGKVSVDNIVTYGDCYAFIKEVQTDGTHQLIPDIIIVHYTIKEGETTPTWLDDIYVYTPASNGQEATVKSYSRKAGTITYTDSNSKVYENVSKEGNTLKIINNKAPYALEINKINALSNTGIQNVQFEAIIRHKDKNGDPKEIPLATTVEDGKITIKDIFEYSENDDDLITLELYEKVPEGFLGYDKAGKHKLLFVADYIKKAPAGDEGKLIQKSGYVVLVNTEKTEENNVENFIKIAGDKTSEKFAFTISEEGQGDNNSSTHTVTVPNIPTYSLQAIKKELFNGVLMDVDPTGIKFTGKIRKGGIDNGNGEILQYGQPYTGTEELDPSKFTVELKKIDKNNGNIIVVSADGIDTHSEFFDENGKLKDNTQPQTFTLVLEEEGTGKYAIEHPIEIEYTCQPNATDGTWTTEYKKVKFDGKTKEITKDEQGATTVLIDSYELVIMVDKDGHLILVNIPKFEPIQILLQKKDEDGNLVDGITFKGSIEELGGKYKDGEITIKGEENHKQEFEATTGTETAPDGNQYNGVAVIKDVKLSGNVKLTITEEKWAEDAQNKTPLDFPKGPIEITGLYIEEYKQDNVTYRKLTVPNGKLKVKVGENGEEKEIDINNPKSSEESDFDITFSTDKNVTTFYITNKYKRYNLADNDEDQDDTPPPFPDKVIRDVQGNDTVYKNEDKRIQFKGTITDSNGEVLQEDVKVTFEKKATQNGGSKVSIDAIGIKGSISGEGKEFKLVLNENTGDEPITVIYTCTYDSSLELFTARIIGYEYKGVRYNKKEKPLESPIKADIVPGRVDDDGSLINYNKLYIPITKYDEKGKLVNGVVFKGTIEYPKDENGKPTKYGEDGKTAWEFETVTGGQYYNFEKAKMETAPDGVAVIPVPYEMDGDFVVTITNEYWGTKDGDKWTTTKSESGMPEGQPYDLEFMTVDAEIKGFKVEKKTVDEWKTESKLLLNGKEVKYELKEDAQQNEAINVAKYDYITVDEDGHIKFVNDEIRYNLDKSASPTTEDLFDGGKLWVSSTGEVTQVKDGIYFTGYIKDKDGKILQQGQPTNVEQPDKNKFTVGLNSEGRITATGILGEISGNQDTEFYFVLQELAGEKGQPLEITVIYTSVYNKQNRTFDIKIKGYEYNGKRYNIEQNSNNNEQDKFEQIVAGHVWHKTTNTKTTTRYLINVLETSIPLMKYEEAKKSDGGQQILRNGIQFTGKVEAVEEINGENGQNGYKVKQNTEGKEISQYFKVVTGEKQKDINGNNCKDPKTGIEYPAYDGVATIYGITKDYVGKVRITITEEKWKDGKQLSADENDVNFVDDIIEIIVDVKEEKEADGTKKLVVDYGQNLTWDTYSKNETTENSVSTTEGKELKDIVDEVIKSKNGSSKTTETYKTQTNDEFTSALLDIDTYNNENKQDDVIGIKIVNEVKTYDIEIPKVVEKTENGKKTYRALTPEEAAELRFTAKIYDSTYQENGQNNKPIQELDENHVKVVVLDKEGNEIKAGEQKDSNNNNQETKSVVRVSGIRGSIQGENLTLVLHEEESGGIQKIEKDIQVTYKYTNNEADKDGKPELLTFKDPNVTSGNGNGIIDVKQIDKQNGKEQYKETNDTKNPNLVVTDDGVAIVQKQKEATLVIKKVKKVKDANGIEVEEPVSGIKFTIRVCGKCEHECDKDPEKCICGNECDKCKTLEATSNGDGIAEFKGITETGDVKVVILKEEWATENGVSTEAEKAGNDKIEFIKEPVVISGIEIKKGTNSDGNNGNTNTVDYSKAKVEESKTTEGETDDKASSHVSIDKDFGMQIVFKNDTATYDLDVFDSKVTNYNGTIEKVLKDVTFEAVITKHKEGAPDVTLSNDDSTFNLNDYYERNEKAQEKLQYIGPFGIDTDGKIKVKGIKGTIAKQVQANAEAQAQQAQTNDAETNGTYDVILREVSSNRSPNSEETTDGEKPEEIKRPIIKIVYEATCTTDEKGDCKFATKVKEYIWKDGDKTHKYSVPDKKETVEVEAADEEPAVNLQANGSVANGKTVELKNSESFGEVLYIHENGKVSLINTEKYPVAINLKKVDSNGNPVSGIKFTGKVIALLNATDETLIPKEEITDPSEGKLKQKKIEFEFGENSNTDKQNTNSGITDTDGVALLEIPEDEIFNYEGEIEVVITNEEWVESTNKPVLGFPKEPFAITGLTLKTDPQTHKSKIVYGDVKVEKCDDKGNKVENGESAYKDKVKTYSTEEGKATLGISVENPILDYDLDLGYKVLKHGDTIVPLKEGVGFKAEVFKTKPTEENQKGDSQPEVVLNSQDGGIEIDATQGKITAKGIKGDITGSGIQLVLTETSSEHNVKPMEITIVYDYNPDGKPEEKPIIKEYKWKEKQENGEEKEITYKVPQDGAKDETGEEAKNTQIGNMIYTNYNQSVGIINEVIPNPLDIQIEKIDSNGATVAGIKFEGRIVALDDQGQERKDESGKTIEKKFTTTITNEDGTTESLEWITTDSEGIARLHLTEEEVNQFAGKVKIEISKEAWSTDERDPLSVEPENRTPLDFIGGTVEITGKKIKVEADSTSSIENDGEVTVKIKNGDTDVTEQYKDRVDAKAPGAISVSMKNNINRYNLMNIFDKKVIIVNNQEVAIPEGIEFTGKIFTDENTKYYYTDENNEKKEIDSSEYDVSVGFSQTLEELTGNNIDENAQIKKGSISAAGINGNIVGANIKLIIPEQKTLDYIIPEKIIVEYDCSYHNGKFETKINKRGLDKNNNDIIDSGEEITVEDNQEAVLQEEVVRTGVEIPIKKVDQQGNPVQGIKFTGYVISDSKNSKEEGVAFEVTTNENGIATIELKADYSDKNNIKDEIKDKNLLGHFNVVIEKEEWADNAESVWRAIPGNEHRILRFVANNTTIQGFDMQEAISENAVIRTISFNEATCENEHVNVDKNTVTVNVDNPDLTYDIPFIKTDELITEENKDKVNRLENIRFHAMIESGNDKQDFYPETGKDGMFTLDDIHVFSNGETPVTLTLQELPADDLSVQILEKPIVVTYKTEVNYETGKVTIKDVKIVEDGIEKDADSVNNQATDEANNTDKTVDYMKVTFGEGEEAKEYNLFDIVNRPTIVITLDKKVRVNGNDDNNIKDVIEEIGFTGFVTTNPGKFGIQTTTDESGKIQYTVTKDTFEANLNPSMLKDNNSSDTIYFSGTTKNGKLEIPGIKFYDKQIYVIFKEYFINDKKPSSMKCSDEVMVASFNRKLGNKEATSTSSENVTFTNMDPVNISIQVINEAINYKVNLKKVDSDDKNRAVNYKNAKFTITLKELGEMNNTKEEYTESEDTVTLVFNGNGEINKDSSTKLPSKYIVGAELVTENNGQKHISLEVNKFGDNLQLVVTEEQAPTGYDKYDGDIVINYSTSDPGETQEKTNITVKGTVGQNITTTTGSDNGELSLTFELPNAPSSYPLEFYKKSKDDSTNINGVHFQILFMDKEGTRILEDKGQIFTSVQGKVSIPNVDKYGTYYMIVKETDTPEDVVRLEGYHIIEVTANIGQKPILKYKGTFVEGENKNAIDNEEQIKQILEKAKKHVENNFAGLTNNEGEVDENGIVTKEGFFVDNTNGADKLYFTIKNETSAKYDINISKKDKSDKNKNLSGAEFDLYLVKANEDYASSTNLLKYSDNPDENDRHKVTDSSGRISIKDLGYIEEHYSKNTYTEEEIKAIENGTSSENLDDMLKLVLVETKPPKDYKSEFKRIEITYYTHDGKDIKIIKIEAFDEKGNKLNNVESNVNYVDKNDKKESEINLEVYNTKKTEIPLQIKKVYYTEEFVDEEQEKKKGINDASGQKKRVEYPLANAKFSGVVYEEDSVEDGEPFEVITDKDGIAKIEDIYVEGKIKIIINEVSAPTGFNVLPQTTIECTVNGTKLENCTISANDVASVDEVDGTNQITMIEDDDTPYTVELGGFVWEDRPTTTSAKGDGGYTAEQDNKFVSTEGLYDENNEDNQLAQDVLIKTVDKDGKTINPVGEDGKISDTDKAQIKDGIIVNLYKYSDGTLVKQTTTNDTGRFSFKDLDPFEKYYITFTMCGKYNYEDYENVKFLVKSATKGEDGKYTFEQTDSVKTIKDAIEQETKKGIAQQGKSEEEIKAEGKAKSIDEISNEYKWKQNSKAVLDEPNNNNNDKNTAIATQTKVYSNEKNDNNPTGAGRQAYPIYDQFILSDSTTSGADAAIIYEGSGQKDEEDITQDYTLNKNDKQLIFYALDPIHDYINLGIIERTKFGLRLEKFVEEIKVQTSKNYTYHYGEKAQGSMYTLNINQADLSVLKDIEVTYKIVISREEIAEGTVKSIADYYNSDLLDFESCSVVVPKDGGTTSINIQKVENKPEENNTQCAYVDKEFGIKLVPVQYMEKSGSEAGNLKKDETANTGRVIINLNQDIKGNNITVFVKYKYQKVNGGDKFIDSNGKLFGKIQSVGSEYVTLGVAEILDSISTNGRKDANSTNGDLDKKFKTTYQSSFPEFYALTTDSDGPVAPNEEQYYEILSHKYDKDRDEDTAPAIKVLIADPSNRKISGQVFDDENKNGIKDNGEVGIGGIKVVAMNESNQPIKETMTLTEKQDDKEIGSYEITGVPEGKYHLEFTYGNENTILPKLYEVSDDDNTENVGDSDEHNINKATGINDVETVDGKEYHRYNDRSYNGLEYESTAKYPSQVTDQSKVSKDSEFWYKDEARQDTVYSDAEDNSDQRTQADKTLNEYGANGKAKGTAENPKYLMNNEKAELLYSYRGTNIVGEYLEKLVENAVTAATEEFKINIADSEETYYDYNGTEGKEGVYTDKNGNVIGNSNAQINFGIKPRAMTNLKVDKVVKDIKIYTSAGNTDVDASYDGNKPVGTVGRVQWLPGNTETGSRGYIWIQRSDEEIVGAKLQITYEIVVRDESGESTEDEEVTIVDYVQTGMTFDKEFNEENRNWNLANAKTTIEGANKASIISDTFGDTIKGTNGDIKISNKIDLTNVSTVATRDIELKHENGNVHYSDPVEITLTKTLNGYSNTDIDAYTNYVEVIQTATPKLARKDEKSIPGNFDPQKETTVNGSIGAIGNLKSLTTKDLISREITEVPYDGQVPDDYVNERIRLERDTAKALETVSITAETGENRDTTYYILAFAIIAVFATGVGVIVTKVIKKK